MDLDSESIQEVPVTSRPKREERREREEEEGKREEEGGVERVKMKEDQEREGKGGEKDISQYMCPYRTFKGIKEGVGE